MSERKVLNKYYPPDFDPSKIPRMKLARNRQYTVRLMAPFNMRCKTCGEYIYKGKKFNARKEDVEGDTYLGIRIYRFYIKCTRCLQEISFKTDPKNTDYEIEAGATRNFMALKLAEEQAQREEDEEKEEEATNPMKLLEKRTQQSKQELDLLESLEDLKDLNRRQQTIDYDVMLEQYDTSAERQRTEKEQEELDEQLVKEIFKNKKRTIGKVVEEETVELEDDATATTAAAAAAVVTDEPSNKMQKTAPKVNYASIADRRKNLGIRVKSQEQPKNVAVEANGVDIVNKDKDSSENSSKTDSVSTQNTTSGLSLLGAYSGSSDEALQRDLAETKPISLQEAESPIPRTKRRTGKD
ncbi:coiled-coil domain-containing protein 94 [Copidosoma floridanum]|uniref:coiled-coil domain-containing protein 94 n=1 Tax=Copidosoma floridanum TaxID=29053 RepID=UPI0006C97EBA|nr:coiled-coil domain-containing protein 94 [Copidosoma floridanum]